MQPQQRSWFFARTRGVPNHTSEEILAAFVLTLVDDLNTVTRHAPDLLRRLQFAEPFASEVLPAAWEEVTRTVPALHRYFLRGVSAEDLSSRGLTGRQLQLKVTAWDESRRSLVELLDERRTGEVVSEPRLDMQLEDETLFAAPVFAPALHIPGIGPGSFWPRRLLRRLAKTLDYADTILGSIAPVVPIIEPLKEYKETAEKVCGDAAEIQAQ